MHQCAPKIHLVWTADERLAASRNLIYNEHLTRPSCRSSWSNKHPTQTSEPWLTRFITMNLFSFFFFFFPLHGGHITYISQAGPFRHTTINLYATSNLFRTSRTKRNERYLWLHAIHPDTAPLHVTSKEVFVPWKETLWVRAPHQRTRNKKQYNILTMLHCIAGLATQGNKNYSFPTSTHTRGIMQHMEKKKEEKKKKHPDNYQQTLCLWVICNERNNRIFRFEARNPHGDGRTNTIPVAKPDFNR